jgi:hypothetical protein
VTDFDDDERSVAQGRPIDLFTIVTTSETFHLTSHVVNVTFGGQVFTAITMSRGDLQAAQDLTSRELIVYLPITHPIVQRYAAFGIPAQSVLVTLQRLQEVSGLAVQAWQGFGNALTVEGHTAQMRVPPITSDAMAIKLPIVGASKTCPHVLFDRQCSPPVFGGPSRAAFTVDCQGPVQIGNTLLVSGLSGTVPNGWATFGYVQMLNGTRRQIWNHVLGTLTIDAPFADADISGQVFVVAGCDHLIATCRDKFSNVINQGGMPYLNSAIDPWAPKGLGIVQQF